MVAVDTYRAFRKINRWHVVYVGPKGGQRIIAVYADETSAVKLCDLLLSQQRYESRG